MNIEDLKGKSREFNGICHDCGKPVEVRITVNNPRQIEISGGAVYKVKQQYARGELFFKCDSCFEKDKTLRNFRATEVYSRVVGYYRPVAQWNAGKKAEMDMRVEFTNVGKRDEDDNKERRSDEK